MRSQLPDGVGAPQGGMDLRVKILGKGQRQRRGAPLGTFPLRAPPGPRRTRRRMLRSQTAGGEKSHLEGEVTVAVSTERVYSHTCDELKV